MTAQPIYVDYQNDYRSAGYSQDTKGNGFGEQGFNNYQEKVGTLTTLWGGRVVSQDNHEDRVDAKGNIYSWDQNAGGGKGAWGVSGHVKDINTWMMGNTDTSNIQWNTKDQYAAESGLGYNNSTYDPAKDPNRV